MRTSEGMKPNRAAAAAAMSPDVIDEGVQIAEKTAQKLDFSGMFLVAVPSSSVDFGFITNLDLSNNNLESIPESVTARLLNLIVLDLHSNQLKALPNSIGCLSKLRALNICSNHLESLPKSIENCRALQELAANLNRLRELPETMGFELTYLQKLAVNCNKLAFLPKSTSYMTSLRVLDVRLNCLRSLPDGLERLVHLQVLNLAQNFHHLRSLPTSLGLLVSLVEIDVSYNSITVLPYSLAGLARLRNLRADGNPLVRPPMEVVQESVDAVREYLGSMERGEAAAVRRRERRYNSWVKKLVSCGGGVGAGDVGVRGENDGYLLPSDYRSIDGLASPRYVGMFSPRRLFSPRRGTPARRLY